jgi:hypothetical protein
MPSYRNGQLHDFLKQSSGDHPISAYEQNKFKEEKMLIEQDPFLLEEQRYLSRMQRAHNK